jgi:hypothetical protein
MVFKDTGARKNEVLNINVEDIDFKNNTIHIYQTKLKKEKENDRVVTKECVKAIQDYIDIREEPKEGHITDADGRELLHKDALFLNGFGKRQSSSYANRKLKEYASRVGITKNVYPHILRHTTCTNLTNSDMNDYQIMAHTGHKNPKTLKRYSHLTSLDVKDKVLDSVSIKEEVEPKKPDVPIDPNIKKKEEETDTYIAKPTSNDSKMAEIQMGLLEQLSKGQISQKAYDNAIARLETLSKPQNNRRLIGYE